MMLRVKGCVNETCVANQKKITYKEADDYCSKCGSKLHYVCKECYTQLPDDSEKYCVRCLAEKQDRKDKTKNHALKIAGGAVGAAGVVVASIGKGKEIIKVIAKLK